MANKNGWLPEVFNDFFYTDYMPRTSATAPAINVKETAASYIVEMAAPGMRKEDFTVHINDDGDLTIKMENKHENAGEAEKAHYLRREFAYSKYEQTLILPDDVERDARPPICQFITGFATNLSVSQSIRLNFCILNSCLRKTFGLTS